MMVIFKSKILILSIFYLVKNFLNFDIILIIEKLLSKPFKLIPLLTKIIGSFNDKTN